MKTRRTTSPSSFHSQASLLRVSIFVAFAALAILPLLTVSSASLSHRSSAHSRDIAAKLSLSPNASPSGIGRAIQNSNGFNVGLTPMAPFAFMPQAGPVESVTIFQSDCFNPSQSFELSDTVCAKIQGAPIGTRVQRRVVFVNPAGYIVAKFDVTSSTQDFTFTLPTDQTSTFGDEVVDNRGSWTVHSVATVDGSIRASAWFTVNDPAEAVADLAVTKFVSGPSEVAGGSTITFTVFVTNYGPNTATGVTLADAVPLNASFVDQFQDSGPAFLCVNPPAGATGTSNCTLASLAINEVAVLRFVYQVDTGVAAETEIVNTANVSSTTEERFAPDNTASASVIVTGAPPTETCTIDCRENMSVTADTTFEGNPGAYVTFTSTTVINGNCGAITASPASGSFFPVGTHTVNVTSETNGGSCSFTITVLNTPAPTITCPADQTVTAASGDNSATVNPGTPTTTPSSGVTVTSERSDEQPLNAQYPVGITVITWTVKETSSGRTATCNQRITVHASDRVGLTISCPSNKAYAAEGCAGRTLTAAEIGAPTTNPSDNQVSVEGVRNDGSLLTDPFPVGSTQITWTATDAANDSVASCVQTITITTGNDSTPPVVTPPPDVTVSTSSCTQFVGDEQLGSASATDDCSQSVSTITRSGVPAGNIFPTGTTVITYSATDASGNTGAATQNVIVQESPAQPPSVTAPADVTVQTGASATSCDAVVSDAALGSATASDNCPGVTVARTGVPAGNVFQVGTTVVTYTATDRSGNTATDTQNVTVEDNTNPVVTAPADVTAYTGPGATSCDTVVDDTTLGSATATDNCPGVGAVNRSGVPAGNVFPVGTTTLTYMVTDAHGNTSSDTQTVTVIDNTVPVVTAPAAVTLYTGPGATSCSVTVNNLDGTFGTGSATDNCPGVGAVSRSGVPSGNVFPVGTTTLTYSATDAHGNTGSAPQVVTVIDNTQPVISCPANITIESTCPTGAIATYATPTATDNCGVQSIVRTAGLASGSVFPIGTTTVTHMATDIHGNTASCSFTVTVLTPQAVVQNLIAAVDASSLSGPQKNGLLSKLNAALTAINGGGGNACAKLSDFVNSVGNLISHGDISAAQGNAWISSANNVRNTIGCTNLPCS